MNRTSSGHAYFLPKGTQTEIDRLDIQHYALAIATGGLFVAPVREPRHVLDVGCGTGQWCFDICADYPDARLVGFDLQPGKQTKLSNYCFVQGDVIHGLPFGDAAFDFVHQRFISPGIPLRHWSQVVKELVRVSTPGGWVELAEPQPFLSPEGPAGKRLWDILRDRMARAGLDTTGHVHKNLDLYLRDAGLINIGARTVMLPMGDWGDEVGRMMKQDFRSMATKLSPMLAEHSRISVEKQRGLITQMLDELEEIEPHPYLSFRIAYGQRRHVSG